MQGKCRYSTDGEVQKLKNRKTPASAETEKKKKTPQIFQNQSPYSVTQPCLVMFVNILA